MIRELIYKACLECHKMSRSAHPPARILKVYTEDLTGSSHVYCPDGLNTHYCSSPALKAVSREGKTSRTHIPKTGVGMRNLRLLGFSW